MKKLQGDGGRGGGGGGGEGRRGKGGIYPVRRIQLCLLFPTRAPAVQG